MSNQTETRRARLRKRSKFPPGLFVGLIAAACITLIGIVLGLDPIVILSRAGLSAVILGTLVSFGISVLGLTDDDHRKRNHTRR